MNVSSIRRSTQKFVFRTILIATILVVLASSLTTFLVDRYLIH